MCSPSKERLFSLEFVVLLDKHSHVLGREKVFGYIQAFIKLFKMFFINFGIY